MGISGRDFELGCRRREHVTQTRMYGDAIMKVFSLLSGEGTVDGKDRLNALLLPSSRENETRTRNFPSCLGSQ